MLPLTSPYQRTASLVPSKRMVRLPVLGGLVGGPVTGSVVGGPVEGCGSLNNLFSFERRKWISRRPTHPDQWARQRTERAQRRWWHPTRRGRHPQRYPRQRRFRRQGQRPSRRCRPRPDRGLGRRRDRGEPTSCLGRWCLEDGGPLGRASTRSVTPWSNVSTG
jgi:hypothetical protein